MNCSGGGGVDYDMWLRQVREYDMCSTIVTLQGFGNFLIIFRNKPQHLSAKELKKPHISEHFYQVNIL